MEVLNLFAVPVVKIKLDDLQDAEKKFIDGLSIERTQNIGNTTSKNRRILQSDELTCLRASIQTGLDEYVKSIIAPSDNVEFKITQSWLNFTKQGQFHHKHAHPGSLISGVYYVSTDDDDRIMFYRSGFQRIKFNPASYNPWNSDSWWIPVKSGELILFPSELEHSVPPIQTDHERISLAFNTWFSGECGSEDDLTHLSLSIGAPYV